MDLSTISEDWLNTEFAALADEFDQNLDNSSSQTNSQVMLLSADPSNALEPLRDRSMEPNDFLVGSLDKELHYRETPYNPSQGMDPQLALMAGT